jgi:hypothetical protein
MGTNKEHRKKLRLARGMMTKIERKIHKSPFDTKAWNERKENKANKIRNLQVSSLWRKQNRYEDSKTA